ncbi:hypothetical protein B296_00014534, partial [Ensete ventricosum]
MRTGRYRAVSPKGGRQQLIEGKIDRRRSISAVGSRLRRNREGKKKKKKKNKKRKRRKKKKKRRRKGTSSRPRSLVVATLAPRAIATHGSLVSLRPTGDFSLHAGRGD